ncbi:ATP-binding cassette domain-containing protein [Desulfatitalea alkaliphila]|uniref:ATP-binding cassette domain-containing protein n=1 Tax=Desulfatitalea alkaliphila TaxID=2929485 RepID=A0AA41QZ58_9BACT|nr:ATP-binding cassette domain-containing protein [Desulfatitalea alkaliphila]MCJ8499757.1 ATP-binding cassette domain-containing protein [Desulfatitalea alkaliphila]
MHQMSMSTDAAERGPAPQAATARPVAALTVLAGTCKDGKPERVAELTIRAGECLAVVGPTGSGKSELLADIEQLARGDTISGRRILINRAAPGDTLNGGGLVARLSQRTGFIMDGTVATFLRRHAESKQRATDGLVEAVLAVANTLCGEPIRPEADLPTLSGGQSRALMIADIAAISDAPIVLIDEIENAGIHKFEALNVLSASNKPILIATHDPVLTLMTQQRVVMQNGAMTQLHVTSADEIRCLAGLRRIDATLAACRETLRGGRTLTNGDWIP